MSSTALFGPTRERVAKCADVETPIVDQTKRRNCWRVVGIIEKMVKSGKICEQRARAFADFEKDIRIVHNSDKLVSGYGRLGGGEPTEALMERRTAAHRRLAGATRAICDPRTVETLIAIATKNTSLEDIGREVLMVNNRSMAIAAVQRTVQMGTYALAVHYGHLHEPIRPG